MDALFSRRGQTTHSYWEVSFGLGQLLSFSAAV